MKKIIFSCLLFFSCSVLSEEQKKVLEKKVLEKNQCAVGFVNLRGVCANPVPVAPRGFTVATVQDGALNSVSLDFIERLRK